MYFQRTIADIAQIDEECSGLALHNREVKAGVNPLMRCHFFSMRIKTDQ